MTTSDKILAAVSGSAPFAFSRWGDGEWACVLGRSGCNCDGHPYTPSLGRALGNVLKGNPKYMLGMQPMAIDLMRFEITKWLTDNKLKFNWENADALHNMSEQGGTAKLTCLFRGRRIILVGPEYLHELKLFQLDNHIIVPEKNCWEAYEDIQDSLFSVKVRDYDIVLFSASMMSKVLIDDLWKQGRGVLLDCGSVFDPYCGRLTRKYHKNVKV